MSPLPASQATPPKRLLMPPFVGEQLGRYSLLAKLATGGMAEIFVARLSGVAGFRKNVVIKRILPHVAHDQQFTQMFLDEALTCASISHPNVCQVFELCESNASYFLVLEYLEGVTLGQIQRQALADARPLDIALVTSIMSQACEGLHAAHEQVDEQGDSTGLVHRDISPGNLFVTIDGMVKLLDFGIAKSRWMSRRTRTGILLGKCEYMSPEQAQGGVPLDRRSDIFSLGILTWELLCGRRLFRRADDYETLRAVLRDPIEEPSRIRESIPKAIGAVVMRALQRDVSKRFQTAEEFRQALCDAADTAMMSHREIGQLVSSGFEAELAQKRQAVLNAGKSCPPNLGRAQELDDEATGITLYPRPTSRIELSDAATNRMLPAQSAPQAHVSAPTQIAAEEPMTATSIHSTAIAPHQPNRRARPYLSIFFASAFAMGAGASIMTLLFSTKPQGPTVASVTSPPPNRRTAVDNAKARADVIEANAGAAVVTALDYGPKLATGMIIVRSSRPATLYLYPEKKIIGHTPLVNYPLPVGNYKIKARVGPGKPGRRYFELEVKADGVTERVLNHWPDADH